MIVSLIYVASGSSTTVIELMQCIK